MTISGLRRAFVHLLPPDAANALKPAQSFDTIGRVGEEQEQKAGEVTRLLQRWAAGETAALDSLWPLVYDDLRRLARRQLAGERGDHTLQRTAQRRGSGARPLSLHDTQAALEADEAQASATFDDDRVDVEAIDSALLNLEKLDAAQSQIVELRYFGGLTIEEAAEALGISPATLKREWSMARAWLAVALRSLGFAAHRRSTTGQRPNRGDDGADDQIA